MSDRKKEFIKRLEIANDNIVVVEIADKLQNLISDYEQYKIEGKEFLITSAKNFDDVKWFYLELKKLFNIVVYLFCKIYYHDITKKVKVIGVTGTNGKTTSVYLFYNLGPDSDIALIIFIASCTRLLPGIIILFT